ncbi:MAG: RNA methyltransferase [FCB group bacterium]|nr:RNA methyltransferase [FCB group bacterium]
MFDFEPTPLSANRQKQIRRLKKKKYRLLHGEFILEGQRLVQTALEASAPLREVVVTKAFLTLPHNSALLRQIRRGTTVHVVTERDIADLSDTTSPAGILAVCPRPEPERSGIVAPKPVLYLDQVRDPGNGGTLLRTAAWLGLETVVASPGSLDLFQPKVVRGGMGAHFHLNIMENRLPEDFPNHVFFIGADQRGKSITELAFSPEKPWVLAVGNEAHGLSDHVRKRSDVLVAIPRRGTGESLNVAVSGALLMWELMKRTAQSR